ncbi:MAG: MlaD family protein [Vulcanimicrobiaceae bacterium]
MTRQAQVGAFALLALLLLFGVFYVITDFGTRHTGYRIGVHFQSAAGLHSGAVVYFSGVSVGTVDSISLLPDNTVDVILAVNRDVDIPSASRFLIQAPLTGDPNLIIVPPVPVPRPAGVTGPTPAPQAVPMLARQVLPIDEQPQGKNSATIADLLQQGQGQIKRLDTILADLESREPRLLDTLQATIENANHLTTTANRTMQEFSVRALQIADSLQGSLGTASRNIDQLTGTLNDTTQLNAKKIDAILSNFQTTSVALNTSMTSLANIASDPSLKSNIVATTKNIAETTNAIAGITKDLRSITGDPQTQHQVRDTVAQLDATMQRANSLLGSLGGSSSVYGVDRDATPAPRPTSTASESPFALPSTAPGGASAPVMPASPQPTVQKLNLKHRLASVARNLLAIQLRVSALSAQQYCCDNPLLTKDRGPQADINAVIFPKAATSFMLGANDIGYHTTANAVALRSFGDGIRLGGGVLYSQLGVLGQFKQQRYGIETRLYNLRRPSLDVYGDLRLMPGAEVFFGQRDMTHITRRTVYGIQLQF